ncbi:MAG: HNH endonuclease signature motif containing protein [Dehalococcoidia bacterium]|nr:HNH endonuclease signature motif containing protein [Dehalococcoidia bacterium]
MSGQPARSGLRSVPNARARIGTDPVKRERIERRFWPKVEKAPDSECWRWTAAFDWGGYGQFAVTHLSIQPAHRVAYELLIAEVPDELEIDHLCRNRWCVNPAHLEPVTHRENMERGLGTMATPLRTNHCKRGHEFTTTNTVISKRNGARHCKTCQQYRPRHIEYERAYRLRKKLRKQG